MGKENFNPNKNSRLCCVHFSEDSFMANKNGKWELKPDAIPEIDIDIEVS